MMINSRVGKYVLVQKAKFGPNELWVFMDGDHAVEWDSSKGIPSEADLDRNY